MDTILDDRPEELGLRERKKQQTRQAIHEAAYRLIDAHGLEATTIDQICSEADVSSRTFFNYFASKASAALGVSEAGVPDAAREWFLSADGGLVPALCQVIGNSAQVGLSHIKLKQLVSRRPELLTTATRIMTETRGQFIALAAERSADVEQAELAVTLVFAALSRVLHDDEDSTVSLTDQLRDTIDRLVEVSGQELRPYTAD